MVVDNIMMDMEGTLDDFNGVKGMVLSRLVLDKVITDEQATEYNEKWNIIIIKPTWFKAWANKFKKDSKNYIVKYVRFED